MYKTDPLELTMHGFVIALTGLHVCVLALKLQFVPFSVEHVYMHACGRYEEPLQRVH